MRPQEIGNRLVSLGIATTGESDWKLAYRDFFPTPHRQVLVRLSGGNPGEGKADLDRPTFQVLVRGQENESSGIESKVEAVVAALHRFDGTLSGWVYPDIQRQGDVLYLGRDDNQRPMYSLNFQALRSRTS
jgi:hypothetical protein